MRKKTRLRLFLMLIIGNLLLSFVFIPEVHATASTVTTSTNANMIRFPNQRKTFYDQGRYWVFYQNNTVPISIYYTSSLDGITWETPTRLTSSSYDLHFAVWLDESTHDISYVVDFTNLHYRKGTLQPDGTIVWYDSEQTIYSPWVSDWWYLRDTNTSIAGKNIFDAVNGTYGSSNYTTEVVVGTSAVGSLFYINPFLNTTSSFGVVEPAGITDRGWRTSQFTKNYSHGGWTPNIRLQVRYTNTFKGRIGIRIWNDTNADLSTATVLNDWEWLDEETYTTSGEEITTNQEIYLPNITLTSQYMYFEFIFNVTQAGTNVDAGFFLRANDVYARVRANAMIFWHSGAYFSIVPDSSDYPYIGVQNSNGFNNTVMVASGSLNNGSWGITTWAELYENPDISDNYNIVLVQLDNDKIMAMYQTGYHPINTRLYDGVSSWAAEVNVTNTLNDYPYYKEEWAIGTDGTAIHLVYNNRTVGTTGVLRYSNWTETSGWLSPEAIGGDVADDKSPSVTLSQNGTLYAVWPNSSAIMYKSRNPSSGAWSSSVTVLETDSGIQLRSGVQTSFSDYGNRMTVAWTRLAAGQYDVRFSYLPIAPYTFTFRGPYDETTGLLIYSNVTYESNEPTTTIENNIYDQVQLGQTFTPQESHTISYVSLQIYSVGTGIGTLELSIRNTTAGEPDATREVYVQINSTEVIDRWGTWHTFRFETPYAVVSGAQYALVLNASGGDSVNRIVWLGDGDTYARGTRASTNNGGGNWIYSPGYDMAFEEIMREIGMTVTAYFDDGSDNEEFVVRETYVYAGRPETHKPLYFKFGTSSEREYWLSDDETTGDIYIFDDTLTSYTVVFLDLAGALDDYPFVEAQYYVNGTLRTVEKRKVDEEKKIGMYLVNGRKYNLVIQDGSSYTFGDLLMTSTTTIQLTLKGIAFPKDTLLVYRYVRIYGTRTLGASGTGNITITYQDTLTLTNSVEILINYRNGTNAYNATETSDSFSHVWTSAQNNTDYAVVVNIDHVRYGVYTWRQYFPRSFSTPPWGLGFLGVLPFNTNIIVPSLLIVFVAGCFSVINAEVGAFMAVVTAAILTYLGWIPIAPGYLITAFSLAIFMGIIYAKRRIQV